MHAKLLFIFVIDVQLIKLKMQIEFLYVVSIDYQILYIHN